MNAPIQQNEKQPGAGQRTLRMWLSLGGLALPLVGTFLVGCSGSSVTGNAIPTSAASVVTQVSMRNLQFDPVTIEIKIGDMVEWKNDDIVVHTATSALFDSGTIASGQSWRHSFTNAGEFAYACTFHPQMKGVVIVK